MSRMDKILEIAELDLYAIVEPGVLNAELRDCGGRGTRTHKPFRATVFKS